MRGQRGAPPSKNVPIFAPKASTYIVRKSHEKNLILLSAEYAANYILDRSGHIVPPPMSDRVKLTVLEEGRKEEELKNVELASQLKT